MSSLPPLARVFRALRAEQGVDQLDLELAMNCADAHLPQPARDAGGPIPAQRSCAATSSPTHCSGTLSATSSVPGSSPRSSRLLWPRELEQLHLPQLLRQLPDDHLDDVDDHDDDADVHDDEQELADEVELEDG